VTQVYQDLLHRQADPAAQSNWTAALNAGLSRSQFVEGVEQSAEYRSVVVGAQYKLLLNRAADSAGLAFFTGQMAAGATDEQVAAAIAGSGEYFQSRGGNTNNGFLTALYKDFLGRSIDAGGLATYTQALNAGLSRYLVVLTILGSAEYQQDLVQGYYQNFLRRAADSAGLANFVSFLQQGGPDENVITAIVASNEYFNRL
jgi:hypothetical protein